MDRLLRVVKVGGSLLDYTELSAELRRWRDRQPPAVDVLIAGGGAFADAVRKADQLHRLGDQAAHILALHCLSLSARLLAALLPDSPVVGRLQDINGCARTPSADPLILDLWACWQDAESRRDLAMLPASWDVTSDSLAAAAAHALDAGELVLLKSAAPPMAAELDELAAAGFVDHYFPLAANGLVVRLVNLRSAEFTETTVAAEPAMPRSAQRHSVSRGSGV